MNRTFKWNPYEDSREKKTLLLSCTKNFRGINDWRSLRRYQVAINLANYLQKPVQVLAWKELEDLNSILTSFDHVILTGSGQKHPNSRHYKFVELFVNTFNGKCSWLGDTDSFIDKLSYQNKLLPYIQNDMTWEFELYLKGLPNLTIGDKYCFNLWTPETNAIALHNDINLKGAIEDRRYKEVTVYFGKLKPGGRPQSFQLADNIYKRMLQLRADKIWYIPPVFCDGWEAEFTGYIKNLIDQSDKIDMMRVKKMKISNPWKNSIWNPLTRKPTGVNYEKVS